MLSKAAKTLRLPTEPTPFARLLGIDMLPRIDRIDQSLHFKITPSDQQTNYFSLTHGGYVAGLFDALADMLVAQILGAKATVTEKLTCEFHTPVRPGQELMFELFVKDKTDTNVRVCGLVRSKARIIAELDCRLLRRDTRIRS